MKALTEERLIEIIRAELKAGLKGFATKDDLKGFATKDDLKNEIGELRAHMDRRFKEMSSYVNQSKMEILEQIAWFGGRMDKVQSGISDAAVGMHQVSDAVDGLQHGLATINNGFETAGFKDFNRVGS